VAVKRALDPTGPRPSVWRLEITETLLLEKADHVLVTLHALRAFSLGVPMDDSGNGTDRLDQ
jgi:EAL domain-containing protein (putative c-di-GMP-specific phosphodiesterase class I)